MKTLWKKKSQTLILALCLVAQMVAPVGAAYTAPGGGATADLTINTTTGTFDLYHLYDGDGEMTTDATLAAVLNTTMPGSSDSYDTNLKSSSYTFTNENFAALLAALETAAATATHNYQISSADSYTKTVDHGYYFIHNSNGLPFSLVQVDGDTTVNLKTEPLTMTKEIQHNETSAWGPVGDNQIGDDVFFRIKSELPEATDMKYYDNYVYTITDTMDDTLEFDATSLKIYTDNYGGTTLDAKYYSVRTNSTSTFNVDVDVITLLGDHPSFTDLYLEYSAVLQPDAKLAVDSNDNTAYLIYSNDPYKLASYSENVPYGSDGTTTNTIKDGTGTTYTPGTITSGTAKTGLGEVDDTVYDYTFTVEVTKIKKGDSTTELQGAVFALKDGDGSYLYLEKSGANYYVDNSQTLTSPTASTTAGVVVMTGVSDFTLIGLDDDTTYQLEELKAPTDYNLPSAPFEFTIAATYDGNSDVQTLTIATDGGTTNHASGVLSMTVENSSGLILPSTGGIGDYGFYFLGTGVIVLAGFLVVLKKRNQL